MWREADRCGEHVVHGPSLQSSVPKTAFKGGEIAPSESSYKCFLRGLQDNRTPSYGAPLSLRLMFDRTLDIVNQEANDEPCSDDEPYSGCSNG